jgi:hypothetical protein
MKLIFDNREALVEKPSLLAFTVGVGDLPYSDIPDVQRTFGIRPIRGVARSATELAQWLIDHKDSLPRPLGTVRLSVADVSSTDWTGLALYDSEKGQGTEMRAIIGAERWAWMSAGESRLASTAYELTFKKCSISISMDTDRASCPPSARRRPPPA